MRELVLQERKVLGDLHHDSEIAVEGARLKGSEKRIEFGQMGALDGLLLFDGLSDGGEAALEVEGGKCDNRSRFR